MGIPIPSGLLMMAKSLLTVEGLARGIDADVPLARVAGPVLFRAADPGFSDFVALAKQLPNILGRYMRKD
jgi:predicted unusual protein kinase regulating ubiquinone biosynthesis (AarF/ABC1/UbiB family)